AYDDAINILAKAVSNLYPYEHGASAGDPVIPIATGEIITSGDTTYIVDSAVVDGDTGTVILTLYDSVSKPKITEVQEGDTVSFDGGKFTVNSVDRSGDTGIITITLYQE
ncbi:MAG: hypothetical protein II877_12210, partial [Synergistaceae bacterium]|nr:hypothetical protein [Synergistaceae bacterium]